MKDIRLLAAVKILESKNSSEDKINLLKFANDASIEQVKGLLLKGQMLPESESLTEYVNNNTSEKDLERAIQEAGGRIAKLRKSHYSMVGAGGGTNLFWLLYRKIRSKLDACTDRCGRYEINTSRRQHCMIKCKLDAAMSQLAAARKTKDETQIKAAEKKIAKLKKTFEKSKKSFGKRGAEMP